MRNRFLHSCNSGVALIEFAFVLPLIIIMLVGMLELSYYALINQKLDKVANSMADFVTQGTSVSVGDLNTFGQAVPQIMAPYGFTGTVIFSSVATFTSPSPPCTLTFVSCVKWQHKILGNANSQIGSVGGAASLPGGYSTLPGQNVIVAEVYYQYNPVLASSQNFVSAFVPQTIRKVAVLKPRQGTLTTLLP